MKPKSGSNMSDFCLNVPYFTFFKENIENLGIGGSSLPGAPFFPLKQKNKVCFS